MFSSPEYSFLSSSGIKELATFGAEIEDLVPVRREGFARSLVEGRQVGHSPRN